MTACKDIPRTDCESKGTTPCNGHAGIAECKDGPPTDCESKRTTACRGRSGTAV